MSGKRRSRKRAAAAAVRRGFWSRNGTALRSWATFVLVFLGLMALFLRWGGLVQDLANRWTAGLTAWILAGIGAGGRAEGSVVHSSLYTVEIIFECTAVFPLMIFLAAVVAYPGSLRAKALGLGAGVPAILLINEVRLVSLVFVGRWFPGVFDTAHLVVWQSLMVFFTLLLWLGWAVWSGSDAEPAA